MSEVIIYTDGACKGNPGPGGWACILRYGEHEKTFHGYDAQTTNNRMEMQAVISGLLCLKCSSSVALYTDSRYVMDGAEKWLHNWQKSNWRTAQKKPVKNKDLWQEMAGLLAKHQVKFHWVKGHDGDPLNERCDEMAKRAIIENI